jgi:MFS family permease
VTGTLRVSLPGKHVAWLTWIVALALPVAAIVIASGRSSDIPPDDVGLSMGFLALQLAFSTVGALVGSRHERNPIGWLFCAEGLALSVAGASEGYAAQALEAPGSLPLGDVAAWVSNWSGGALLIAPIVFVFLLFPDGRLSSGRWRLIVWLAVIALGVSVLISAFGPGPLNNNASVTNPFGIKIFGPLTGPLFELSFFLLLVTLIASAACMVLRLRRARGKERQQLKWLASSASLLGVAFIAGPITWSIPSVPDLFWPLMFLVALGSLPIAAGIAILRYRLYDIDLIINRTLVYGALTILLGLVYVMGVVGVGTLVRQVTNEQSNELMIAASTLAVAGFFRPARARIQSLIDRRFYRRKYDAAKTLEAFSGRLRDQVSLDALTADLLAIISDTMQPTHASLWLKNDRGSTSLHGKEALSARQ